MSPSKCKCSSPFGNLVSCPLLTFYPCSFICLSCRYVIYGTYVVCLVARTIIGTIDGATLPLVIFCTLSYVFSHSLLILEPEALPSSDLVFSLKTLLGDPATYFFLFSNVVCISSLVLFTLANGLCGFSLW